LDKNLQPRWKKINSLPKNKTMKETLLLTGAIIANVLTNIGFKYSALNELMPVKKWSWLAVGLVFGLINSVLFTESLRFVSLQVASTVFFALTIVGLYLVSVFWFNEPITLLRLAGAVVVIVGVIMMSMPENIIPYSK
jgi:multidrug transporter EmrE-like cation transporter